MAHAAPYSFHSMSECSICGEEPEQYGDNVCASCFYAPSTASSKSKTFQSVVKSMSERKSVEAGVPRAPNMLTVFSRQFKNKMCDLAPGVYLRFDKTGHALLEEQHLDHLKNFMKHKPGRLKVVPAEEKQVEVAIFVGEDEPEEGVAVEIIVGDEPNDEEAMELFFAADYDEQAAKEEPKNKEDKKSSKKNKS